MPEFDDSVPKASSKSSFKSRLRRPKQNLAAFPCIHIEGRVFDGPSSSSTPEGRRAALNSWIKRIAREVGKPYQTKTARDAATAFVRGHRLTIANCFHRKLVRKDVVSALSALYAEQHGHDPGLTRIE